MALIDDERGVLVGDGRQASFTYERTGNTIRLHMSQDTGYDGARFQLREGGKVLRRRSESITLRFADEPPGPFAPKERTLRAQGVGRVHRMR